MKNRSLKPRQRRFLFKLVPYPIIALIGGLLYYDVEKGLLGSFPIYPATGNPYNSTTSLIAISLMTFLLGLILGTIEEVYFKKRLKKLSFLKKILFKTGIYVLVLIIMLLIVAFILNAVNSGKLMYDSQVVDTVIHFFTSFTFLSVVIYSGAMIGLSLFFSEIVDYLGLDVVGSFFTGKYSKSVVENRVFMFLDMKSSTTIAEKLGHEKHYELINEYYGDMTDPIVQTNGQIYQYVGDEIVISWRSENGLDHMNCIKCFYLIKKTIAAKSDGYMQRFGVVPEFKAGLHFGDVTRGQVGLIKREMLFTGDVLNTTARIQSMCNELQADLVISGALKNALGESFYQYNDKGTFELRGRNQQEALYEVQEK
ncbi:MAG: adenylate/guanylate cyclase domain-containing protein [Cyclobacteriaceae bacterium]